MLKADKLMLPRKMRFTKQFMDDLMSLVTMVTRDIKDRCVQVGYWLIDIAKLWSVQCCLCEWLRDTNQC